MAACAAACRPAPPEPGTPSARHAVALKQGDAVVAEVDGVPITEERVRRLAIATGKSPSSVLDGLIEFELLSAEARRMGLRPDRDGRAAVRKSLVQRYLEEEFEATHMPADISEELLRKAYERNRSVFVQPRRVKVAHILVVAKAGKASAADRAKARAIAETIYREARSAKTVDEFMEIGRAQEGKHPLPVAAESIDQPVAEGANFDQGFIKGALALKEHGDVSRPVESAFGSHVIYLVDSREAMDKSFEEVRETVREQEYPSWREIEFVSLTERLRLASKVTGFTGELRREADR